ncbi:MAG TPA: hypothetical protein VHI13_06080 [Candidatus Kapabacteria bacterium]|nr:hypothetical protein [Candidatus Kapabacteria bacterium]
MSPSFAARILTGNRIAAVLYFLLSAYVFGIWVWSADTKPDAFNADPQSRISDIIYGRAHRPYVQRALIPIITRTVRGAIPDAAADSLSARAQRMPKVREELERLHWEGGFLSEYLIALALAFASLLAFAFTVRALWTTFYETDRWITNAVPLAALLLLPPIFPTGPHYIYDFPALLLFTLGLVALLQRRWLLYYPVLAIGLLNKETMVLLPLLFILLNRHRLRSRAVLLHIAAQGGIFLAIKFAIAAAFAGNPGNTMDFHLFANVDILLRGYGIGALLVIGAFAGLLLHDWRHKHPDLKIAALLIIPMLLLLFWGGIITELRDLYELFPIVLILSLHTILFSTMKIRYRHSLPASDIPYADRRPHIRPTST